MIKPNNPNSEFELGGINHVALVCSDMERTVDFYSNVLGMPLIKSLDLPGGMGQHFFFDAGNGDCVAFFWFADAPDRVPGISSPEAIPGIGDIVSAVSTMNHLAFHVPAEKFDEYRQRLKDKGVRVGPVLNHDESEAQVSADACIPACTCGRSTSTTRTASRSSSPAGPRNSPTTTRRPTPKTAADRRPPVPLGASRSRQLRDGQRVDHRGQQIDQFVVVEPDVAGQPCADRLADAADREMCDAALMRSLSCGRPTRRACWNEQHREQRRRFARACARSPGWTAATLNSSRPTRVSAAMVRTTLAMPARLCSSGGCRRDGGLRGGGDVGDHPVEHRADEVVLVGEALVEVPQRQTPACPQMARTVSSDGSWSRHRGVSSPASSKRRRRSATRSAASTPR